MSLSPIFGYSSFVLQPQETTVRGWGRVTWGMLKSRVQAAYPQAQPDQGGGLKVLGSDLSQNYNLTFNFDSDQRLKSVDLDYYGLPSEASFNELKRWLTERFGQASPLGAWRYGWVRGQTQVTLSRGHNLSLTFARTTQNQV